MANILQVKDRNGSWVAIPAITGATGKDGAKGDPGYTPVKGVDYFDGKDGYTPVKGVDYFDGADGKNGTDGKDGVPCTHSWNATTLTVTSASGTSSADLKGPKGDTGAAGATGPKGDPGSSGVYIGTTAPTDQAITVWVNPDYASQVEAFNAITSAKIKAICT